MSGVTPPLPCGVSPKTLERGVKALLKWRASKSETQKPQLLEEDEFVYLILTLKKIPQQQQSRVNPHKIPLPHPIFNPPHDSTELCLFVDDRPKSGLTKEAARKKVEEDGIPISKIIKISKLRTDYRPFEAKRKLCDSYHLFLADKRVLPLLPKMLGKQFFKKKKIPVGVDLKHKNWKEQVEKTCGSALLFLRTGTCSVVKIGRVSMGKEAIVENALAAISGIAEIVPKKWGGIRSFHVKLLESLALPVYQSVPDLTLKIDGGVGAKESHENDSTMEEKEKVEDSKKKRGRIHEVRYMDTSSILHDNEEEEEEAEDEDEDEGDQMGALKHDKTVKKVKLKNAEANKKKKKVQVQMKEEMRIESEEVNRKKKKKRMA